MYYLGKDCIQNKEGHVVVDFAWWIRDSRRIDILNALIRGYQDGYRDLKVALKLRENR